MSEETLVARLPQCDICFYVYGIKDIPALYDGQTTSGSWANMCQECFETNGTGLGTGRGQRLIVRN
jgi:hypothetical protein